MPEYLAPGVFIEEVSGGAKPIEAVGTSTACFIGFTEKAEQYKIVDGIRVGTPVINKPIFLTSWEEYVDTFGSFVPGYYTPLSVLAFFQNGGKRCYVVSLRAIPKASVAVSSQDANHYLQIRSKLPGVQGESLRASIELLQDYMPVKDPKFTLTITEEGAGPASAAAPATTWEKRETHTISLKEGGSGKNREVSISLKKDAGGKLVDFTIADKVALPLSDVWPDLRHADEEVSGLTWDYSVLVGADTVSLITIAPISATGASRSYRLKLTSQQKSATEYELTFVVEEAVPAPASSGTESGPQSEVFEFTLEETEQYESDVATLKPITPGKSNLITLEVIDKDVLPSWDSLYDIWPVKEQMISLKQAASTETVTSVNQNKNFLYIKPKKDEGNFKALTVKIETTPPVQPKFKLKVERLHEASKRWKVAEEREISLNKKTKKGIFNGQEERRKVLDVVYLNGQTPTAVDLLPLDADANIAQIGLVDLWPVDQSQTMQTGTASTAALSLKVQNRDDKTREDLLGPARIDEYQGDAMERTGIMGLGEIDDINFMCMPDLMKAWSSKKEDQEYVQGVQAMAIAHCDTLKNRVVILDPPPNLNPQEVKLWRMKTAGYDSSRAVLYYPWVQVMDPATNRSTHLPPSGFAAGIWARNDTERGVHKAPANEVVQLAIGAQFEVGQGHQEILNPIGVNCIRPLPGMGIRVWGARTLSNSDPEWRYVNVRRLFHMIEQSIQRSTMWAVFEPNDHRLWAKLRRDVGNFLMTLYSQGMLYGATSSEAFFVKCDAENNPKYTRDLGQVIIDVGVNPPKPAEFVIFRIRQWSPEDESI